MVLQRQWVDLILSKEKVYEIRGANKTPGRYFLGCRLHVVGVATTGPAIRIHDIVQFKALLPLHRWDRDTLPYKKMWALPISDAWSSRAHPLPSQARRHWLGSLRAHSADRDNSSRTDIASSTDTAGGSCRHGTTREAPATAWEDHGAHRAGTGCMAATASTGRATRGGRLRLTPLPRGRLPHKTPSPRAR